MEGGLPDYSLSRSLFLVSYHWNTFNISLKLYHNISDHKRLNKPFRVRSLKISNVVRGQNMEGGLPVNALVFIFVFRRICVIHPLNQKQIFFRVAQTHLTSLCSYMQKHLIHSSDIVVTTFNFAEWRGYSPEDQIFYKLS